MTWRRWALRLLGVTVFSLALAAPGWAPLSKVTSSEQALPDTSAVR